MIPAGLRDAAKGVWPREWGFCMKFKRVRWTDVCANRWVLWLEILIFADLVLWWNLILPWNINKCGEMKEKLHSNLHASENERVKCNDGYSEFPHRPTTSNPNYELNFVYPSSKFPSKIHDSGKFFLIANFLFEFVPVAVGVLSWTASIDPSSSSSSSSKTPSRSENK